MSIVSPNYPDHRAALFDLDGTLLDTIEDIALAMNRVLAARGLGSYSVEAYKTLVGEGAEELVRRVLASRRLSDAEVAGLLADYRREYEACWRLHSRPYPGVPALLEALGRRGVRTAVLSNKSQPFTEAMTAELLSPFRFDIVRGAQPGVPLKPDPAAALGIARGLEIAPAEAVFLGDTNIDMMTATGAGMLPVGALWGFRTAEELRAGGAAALLASPLELLAYFPAD
ncbi:MAG TPA: HAD family hydrolase [Terriglobales bacterium]|nr:HAD family hydrolase [Terriglobales bacterium]